MSTDAQILTALRQAASGSVSGADLAQHLKISRAAIWARIEELRSLGYDIQASPHDGYRLLATPDLIHADDLMSRLGPQHTIGRAIRVFQETTSTNDLVEGLARDGVAEGMVVFAESQTKGKGRLGRRWLSPSRKGLWFSLLLRPKMRPQTVTQLTIGAAVALARAIQQQTGLSPDIKWPNDLLVRGKKIAGILTELSAELDTVKFVVLGIGIDVNQSVTDFPPDLRSIATSLKIATGKPIDRPALAAEILRHLDANYQRIISGDFQPIANDWARRCTTLGENVVIDIGGRRLEGRAELLDSDGALLLRTQHGRLERVVGGDVVLQKSS